MANVSWTQFHPYVMPSVQGCPLAIVNNAIRSAAIEFCEKSNLWLADSVETDILAGEARYGYSTPTGARVSQLVVVEVDDMPLPMTTRHDLDSFNAGWRTLTSATPITCYMDSDSTIRLVGTPTEDKAGALRIVVSLKPSRSSSDCPEFLFEDWAETIAAGALSRLHAMIGKVWANTDLANLHARKFREGLSIAKSKAFKSYSTISKSMMPKSFGDN